MTVQAFIVDTSYLCELFGVDGKSDPTARSEVKRRYVQAVEQESRLYVPLPCIFELGNHIAQVKNGSSRNKLAKSLLSNVKTSVEDTGPWIIKPSQEIEAAISGLCQAFSKEFAKQRIGLTDAFIIHEARRLKGKFQHYQVHIWTKDASLKSHEPDPEPHPYTG